MTFECVVISDCNPLSVNWQNSSAYVLTSHSSTHEHLFVQTILTLSVTNITTEDGGTYTCVAESEAGSVNDSVTLYVAPYFVEQPVDVFSTLGSKVNLNCEAEGFPSPTIFWLVSVSYEPESGSGSGSGVGMPLTDEVLIDSCNSSLVLDPVIFEDTGVVFQCFASNGYGDNVTSNSVTVTGKFQKYFSRYIIMYVIVNIP